MGSRWIPRISGPNAGGGTPPLPGGDHFAPQYLVGNVPAGDPAVAQLAPFRYIPDPGDGTGIETALLEAAVTGGRVYIRRGNYLVVNTPLVVPEGVIVQGEGLRTHIQRDNTSPSNTLFSLLPFTSIEQMVLDAGDGLAVDASELVDITASCELKSLTIDLSLIDVTSPMVGAVHSNSGNVSLTDVTIELPSGISPPVAPADWIVGFRSDITARSTLSNVMVNNGHAGIVITAGEVFLDACDFTCEVMGIHADGGSVYANGRSTTINSIGSETHGCQLLNGDFDLNGLIINAANGAAVPAISISGGAGIATGSVADCKIFTGYSPLIEIGVGAEVTHDVIVQGNRLASAAAIVPVAIGAGADNTNVFGNVSRGSGGTLPTDAGTGTNQALNIWGA